MKNVSFVFIYDTFFFFFLTTVKVLNPQNIDIQLPDYKGYL